MELSGSLQDKIKGDNPVRCGCGFIRLNSKTNKFPELQYVMQCDHCDFHLYKGASTPEEKEEVIKMINKVRQARQVMLHSQNNHLASSAEANKEEENYIKLPRLYSRAAYMQNLYEQAISNYENLRNKLLELPTEKTFTQAPFSSEIGGKLLTD